MAISIIIKTLDEEVRIASAIESACQAIAAIGGEVIVADSGSNDRTVAIATTYPITVVQIATAEQASCGIGPQLGFQYSRNDFICLMDGDMVMDEGFIPEALAFLEAHPEAAGVTGHVEEMNVVNLEFTRRVQRVAPENRIGTIDRMNGGGLYRRAAILESGYFSDRNLHGYEEFDLGIRLRASNWTLHRMDRRFVSHYGHAINAYNLLVRRWKSRYLRGVGELLRAALGRPIWRHLVDELPELRLWFGVYVWFGIMVAMPFVTPNAIQGLLVDLGLVAFVVMAMSIKQRSLALGAYAVTAWFFHAAALPLGFFQRRRPPEGWIESRVLSRAP